MLGVRIPWVNVLLVCLTGVFSSLGLAHLLEPVPAAQAPLATAYPWLTWTVVAEGLRSLLVTWVGLSYVCDRRGEGLPTDRLTVVSMYIVGTVLPLWAWWLLTQTVLGWELVLTVAVLVLGALVAAVSGGSRRRTALGGRAWKQRYDPGSGGFRY